MSASSPVPKDHPLMQAWETYKATEDYANTKRWAERPEHTDGSLWAAFEHGWAAAGGRPPFAAQAPPPDPPGLTDEIEQLRAWKAQHQSALIAMAVELLSAGYKGDGVLDGIKWLAARPADPPGLNHVVDLPEQGTPEDYRRVTKYWRDRAIAAEQVARCSGTAVATPAARPADPPGLDEKQAQALKAAFAAGQASVRVVLRDTVRACSLALNLHDEWCGHRIGSPGHPSFREAEAQLAAARQALAKQEPDATADPPGLVALGAEMRTQDNLMTAHPLFVVEKRATKRSAWEFVTACLTARGAHRFIVENRHNLKGETRVFAYSLNRNDEMIAVRGHLLALPAPARPTEARG